GGKGEEGAPVMELGEKLGAGERVRLLGWVPDAALPALYAEALAFVYPSEYEGFGLQLCESMAVGCPTLASRATSLPEVLGDGGESFGLEQTDELAGLLARVILDDHYRRQLSERARRRCEEFSWPRTAGRALEVCGGAGGGGGATPPPMATTGGASSCSPAPCRASRGRAGGRRTGCARRKVSSSTRSRVRGGC